MSSRQMIHPWRLGGLPGLLLVMLALVSQLALGAVVLPDDAREQSTAALDAASVFCDSTQPTAPGGAPRHHQHGPDCAICPLSVALALPAVILSSGPELPSPTVQLAALAVPVPQARAPPALPRPTPPSRGPPVLS